MQVALRPLADPARQPQSFYEDYHLVGVDAVERGQCTGDPDCVAAGGQSTHAGSLREVALSEPGGVATNLSSFQGMVSVIGAGVGPVAVNYSLQLERPLAPISVSGGPAANLLLVVPLPASGYVSNVLHTTSPFRNAVMQKIAVIRLRFFRSFLILGWLANGAAMFFFHPFVSYMVGLLSLLFVISCIRCANCGKSPYILWKGRHRIGFPVPEVVCSKCGNNHLRDQS
jgi:hypothetical protein